MVRLMMMMMTDVTDIVDTTYRGYPSYAAWCAATISCSPALGAPAWNMPIGSLGYSASPQRAFFPGSVVNLSLYATAANAGNLSYGITSGALPPGLTLAPIVGEITGTITPADALDIITFDGNTRTFNLTKTEAPVTLDTITFDGTAIYNLTKAGTPNTLDMIYGTGAITRFNLRDNGNPVTPADDSYLTVVVNGSAQTLDSDYTIDGAQIVFTSAPLAGDSVDMVYTDRIAYYPSDKEDLAIVINTVTQNASTYNISGDQITFNATKSAAFTDTLDTITFEDGVDTYPLTVTGGTTTLDTITFDGTVETLNTITSNGTNRFALTVTGGTTTLDTITFDGTVETLNTITSNGTNRFALTKNQTGATTTLDLIYGTGVITDFTLRDQSAIYTPADPNNLTVTQNGAQLTLGTDYSIINGSTIRFTNPPLMADIVSMVYATVVEVSVSSTVANLDVVVNGTPVTSGYSVDGSDIVFDSVIPATQQIEIDNKTGTTVFALTQPGTANTLDLIYGTGAITRFNLRDNGNPVTPADDSYLTVEVNGSAQTLDYDYTIDGAQIVFTSAPLAGDSVDMVYTDRVSYTPTDPNDVVVQIDGSAQTLSSDYTLSGNEITFTAVKLNSESMNSLVETEVTNVSPAVANLDVIVDGTPVTSGYSVDGDEIVFDSVIPATQQIEIDNKTGTTVFALTQPGTANTLDLIYGTGAITRFNLRDNGNPVTPADDSYLTVEVNGSAQTLDYDYTIDGAQIVFTSAPLAGDSVDMVYTDRVSYTPTDPSDVVVQIDGDTQTLSSDYTLSGNEITFTAVKLNSESMNSLVETEVTNVSPAAVANLSITINGTTLVPSDESDGYSVSGSNVQFDNPRSMGETSETVIHQGGDTLNSMVHTEVAAFTPAASGKFTVEVGDVLQDPSTYTINIPSRTITFDEAPANNATTTVFLHSEEAKYSFGITATDTVNNQGSLQAFAMYVSKPGIALITPKREVGLVRVAYDNSDSPVVPLAAATYNQGENVTLSLTAGTAGNLAGSGLTFESITGVGTVEGGLEGSPASLAEDTDFTITVKAVETDEPSYNNERTLTIKILQDPDYYSPAS